ncbi:CHAT domain-containing protein [Actinoplanes sp. NPDC049265]|uniref:CHAT domain-containing protein n=1 Tax=Actinoplanes sp. NPDC049265 TaxID=3363902 RepID=UPI0037223D07
MSPDHRELVGAGLAALDNGDESGARSWFAQAARTDDPRVLFDLGAIYQRRLNDPERAEGCYRRAAAAGSVPAMNNLGTLLRRRDELAEAEQWLRRAADAGDGDALNNLGTLYERRGDQARALDHFRRAAARAVPEALYPLVMKLALSGRADEAAAWIGRAADWNSPLVAEQLPFLSRVLADATGARPVSPPGPAPQRSPLTVETTDPPRPRSPLTVETTDPARPRSPLTVETTDPARPRSPLTVDLTDPAGSAARARGVFLSTGQPDHLGLGRDLAGWAAEEQHGDPRVGALSLLGDLERLAFEHDGDRAVLAAALRNGRAAVDEALPTDESYPLAVARLGVTLARHTPSADEARSLLERAVAAVGPGDPRTAEIQSGYGETLLAAGRTEAAVLAHRAAVAATPPDAPERAVRQILLAEALLRWDRPPATRDEARALLEEARTALPAAHRYQSRVAAALIAATAPTGPPPATAEEALERYRRDGELDLLTYAITGLRRRGDRSLLGAALTLLYRRTGDPATLDEAIELLDRSPLELAEALRLRVRRRGGRDDLRRALALARTAAPGHERALAAIAVEVGAATQDSPAVREGVELFRTALRALPEDHPERPAAAAELSAALLLATDDDHAPEAAALALSAVRAEPGRPEFATAAAQALHRVAAGGGPPGTRRRAAELARVAVAATPEGHPERPDRLGVLARILEAGTGPLDEAVAAAETWAAATPPGHPQWDAARTTVARLLAARAVATGDAPEMLAARIELAAVAAHPDVPATERVRAADQWATVSLTLGDRDGAVRAYDQAIALLPVTARRSLTRGDRERHLGAFAGLASRAAAVALDAGDPGLALRWLEQGRGVLLDQALGPSRPAVAGPERAAEFAALVDALDPDPAESPARSAQRRRDLQERLDELVAEIRRRPGGAEFLAPPTAADLIARCAGRPVVLINVADTRTDALLLSGPAPRVIRLPGAELGAVRAQAGTFRVALAATREGPVADRVAAQRSVSALLVWLWDTIARPVLDAALTPTPHGRPRLWWIPTGPLVDLPLHAAGHHDRPGDGRSVLDRAVSSYLPTVRTLPGPPETPRGATAADRPVPPPLLVVALGRTPGAADLPQAATEAAAVRGLLPSATVLADEEATWAAVRAQLPAHRWVHFACHITRSAVRTDEIRLLLYDHERRAVTPADIAALRIPGAELAYLSACDSARSTDRLADEAVHVAGAFRMAGYRHVIATMWTLGDRPAAQVAAAVYPALLRGNGAAEALDAAVGALRERYPATPSRWAAHVHVGA